MVSVLASNAVTKNNGTQEPHMLAAVDFTNIDLSLPFDNELIEEEDPESIQLVADLLMEANSHMGTRYRRGGKTPAGFDCSGFTGYIFKQFGINLSASSRSQYNDGIAVERDEIKPGDLLFFKGSKSNTIGHVGIAVENNPITGEISFIHSAIGGGIRIDHISAPYYSKRFVGARRVIL